MDVISFYLNHNSGMMKEWFWEDNILNCVFKVDIDTDDIDDFLDSLVMQFVNEMIKHFMTTKYIEPIKIIFSHDIGDYLDSFYGEVDICYEQDEKIKIKYTNSTYLEKEKFIKIKQNFN